MTTDRLDAPFALARFRDGDAVALGLVAGERIRRLSDDELGAAGLNAFLAAPDWDRLAALASTDGEWMPLADVTLTAPVEPRLVLQAGANYRQHVIELVAAGLTNNSDRTPEEAREFAAKMMDDRAANGEPYFFIGLPACVVGDDVPLELPAYSDVHDWELELAIVIGREAFGVSREDALGHVYALPQGRNRAGHVPEEEGQCKSCRDPTEQLGHEVHPPFDRADHAGQPQAQGHRRVEMPAGDGAEGRHQDGQHHPVGEGHDEERWPPGPRRRR